MVAHKGAMQTVTMFGIKKECRISALLFCLQSTTKKSVKNALRLVLRFDVETLVELLDTSVNSCYLLLTGVE
jgi:hypothetical protein